jgi:2-oxoglutarate dehydrogenase E1 component
MLIRAYRIRGHLIADLDPLQIQERKNHEELQPSSYGFGPNDYSRKIFLDGVLGLQYANLNEILEILKKTYSSKIGYEFMHVGDPAEKSWIRDRIEGKEKKLLLQKMVKKQYLIKLFKLKDLKNICILNLLEQRDLDLMAVSL